MLYRYGYCLFLLTGFFASAQERPGGWPYYGQNAGGTRYTALDKINVGDVDRLGLAWTYRTGELKKYEGNNAMERATFETTPILIGRVLYLSTASDRVIALDGATGQERWVYDPMVDLREEYSEVSSRGVAAWPAGSEKAERIFIGTIDGRLIALEAATGKPAVSFGRDGTVDLKAGLGPDVAETSPPTVV